MIRIPAQAAAATLGDIDQQAAGVRAIERADGMASLGGQVEIIATAKWEPNFTAETQRRRGSKKGTHTNYRAGVSINSEKLALWGTRP